MEPDSRPTQGSFQINPEVADTLIKITFSTTEAIKDLLQYIGNQENFDNIQLSTLQPIFFGNRENDISFLLDNKLYYFFEHQSTINYNMPLRILFYVTQALESYVKTNSFDIFRNTKLILPEIKCYTIFTGFLAKDALPLPDELLLSESYAKTISTKRHDLELIVHCLDMRITSEEYLEFYKNNTIPKRFGGIHNSLVQYALFVDSLKCWCKINRKNLKTVEGRQYILTLCNLFLQRGYLLYVLENKEVVNMVLEQMTREDIAKQEGWEEGWEEGKEEGKKVGWEEGKREGREEGKRVGKEEGKREGREEGKREGREEGKREGIFAMISFLHEMNISPSKTFQELQSRFQLSEEEVNTYLDKYMAQNQDKI